DFGKGLDVVGEVPATRDEMSEPIVGRARVHRLGQPGEAVVVAEEETARVLEVRWRRRARCRGARRPRRQLRYRVMRRHAESSEIGAVMDTGEARIAGIESVGNAVRRLE